MSTAAASGANANIRPVPAARPVDAPPPRPSMFGAMKQRVFYVGLAMFGQLAIADYKEWQISGRGGGGPTAVGNLGFKDYMKMNALRAQHFVFQPDLVTVTDLANHSELKTFLPANIPAREGTRPSMKSRPWPQREVQSVDALRFRKESELTLDGIAEAHPSTLKLDGSLVEPGLPGLFVRQSSNPACQKVNNEIARFHPYDAGYHVNLAPRDAATVVSQGWGVRYTSSEFGEGHVHLYAPVNQEQVDTIKTIVSAGVQYCLN